MLAAVELPKSLHIVGVLEIPHSIVLLMEVQPVFGSNILRIKISSLPLRECVSAALKHLYESMKNPKTTTTMRHYKLAQHSVKHLGRVSLSQSL